MHIFLNILKMQMNICLRDLPTRKKSRLPSRAPTHAYADCEISGQQPTQLYKEFPRVHEAGHSKKNAAHVPSKLLKYPVVLQIDKNNRDKVTISKNPGMC